MTREQMVYKFYEIIGLPSIEPTLRDKIFIKTGHYPLSEPGVDVCEVVSIENDDTNINLPARVNDDKST